jgi:hypothetical protein
LLSSQPINDGPNRRYKVHTAMLVDYDDKPGSYLCDIPAKGEDREGKIIPSAAARRPDPALQAESDADDATVLAACSAQLKKLTSRDVTDPPGLKPADTDLTGWRIVVRATLPNVGTTFAALSQKGDRVAYCEVDEKGGVGPGTNAYRVAPAPTTLPRHLFSASGGYSLGVRGWMYREVGRVPTRIARLHVEAPNGRSVDVPVRDGWYAIMWSDGDPNGQPPAKYTAYDANGKVVGRR